MKWGHRKPKETSNRGSSNQTQDTSGTGKNRDILKKAAIVTGSLLAAYGVYKLADSGAILKAVHKGQLLVSSSKLEAARWKKNPELSKVDLSADDILTNVVSRINPGYGKFGTKLNCRRCTFAYELSRRGYDVKATRTMKGTGQTYLGVAKATKTKMSRIFESKYHPDATPLVKEIHSSKEGIHAWGSAEKTKDLISALGEHGNRARGELTVKWNAGGAHSLAWENIDGAPVIFDNQTGKMYKTSADIKTLLSNVKAMSVVRLDNADLNEDFLLKWVTNTKEKVNSEAVSKLDNISSSMIDELKSYSDMIKSFQ